jgi:hypothetical protein
VNEQIGPWESTAPWGGEGRGLEWSAGGRVTDLARRSSRAAQPDARNQDLDDLGPLEYSGGIGRVTMFDGRPPYERRSPSDRDALKWRATGRIVPTGIVLPDGQGGLEAFAPDAFPDDVPLRVHVSHRTPERGESELIGFGWMTRLGDGWHMRASVVDPPMPTAWSLMFRDTVAPEVLPSGLVYHLRCEAIEASLAERGSRAVFADWTQATLSPIG